MFLLSSREFLWIITVYLHCINIYIVSHLVLQDTGSDCMANIKHSPVQT